MHKKSPGRPIEFDQEQALEEAMLHFWQYGYESTSIADLRRVMGLSVASIYNTFGSKDELFRLAVERYRSLPQHVSRVLADQNLAPLEAIKRALRSAALMQSNPDHAFGCLVLLGATHSVSEHPEIYDYLKTFREDVTRQIYLLLKKAREGGALQSPYSEEVIADYCRIVLNGIALQARDGASTESLLRVLDIVDETLN